MSLDYIDIGPCPAEEEAADIRQPDFAEANRAECRRFIAAIREVLGYEPEGARLYARRNSHDFGTYREVVCEYDEDYPDSFAYALRCESDAPTRWPATSAD